MYDSQSLLGDWQGLTRTLTREQRRRLKARARRSLRSCSLNAEGDLAVCARFPRHPALHGAMRRSNIASARCRQREGQRAAFPTLLAILPHKSTYKLDMNTCRLGGPMCPFLPVQVACLSACGHHGYSVTPRTDFHQRLHAFEKGIQALGTMRMPAKFKPAMAAHAAAGTPCLRRMPAGQTAPAAAASHMGRGLLGRPWSRTARRCPAAMNDRQRSKGGSRSCRPHAL